jgi:hypothetical protein
MPLIFCCRAIAFTLLAPCRRRHVDASWLPGDIFRHTPCFSRLRFYHCFSPLRYSPMLSRQHDVCQFTPSRYCFRRADEFLRLPDAVTAFSTRPFDTPRDFAVFTAFFFFG